MRIGRIFIAVGLAGLAVAVPRYERLAGRAEMKVWQDKWYAEQREAHVIRGMAFEGDCRIIPPTGEPTTQCYQENTFTFQPGPCFIGNVPMKVTWNNIPWYQSSPPLPKPQKASKQRAPYCFRLEGCPDSDAPLADSGGNKWYHYYKRGYEAALADEEMMRKLTTPMPPGIIEGDPKDGDCLAYGTDGKYYYVSCIAPKLPVAEVGPKQ